MCVPIARVVTSDWIFIGFLDAKRMTSRLRTGILVTMGLVIVVAVLWWQVALREHAEGIEAGWPEKVSLTCLSCSHRFDVSSKQYLSGIAEMKKGAPSVATCLACKSQEVVRTDHLGRPLRRVDQ